MGSYPDAILGGVALVGAVLSIGFGNAVGPRAPFPELIAIRKLCPSLGRCGA